MKRIVVTGALGQIGSELVMKLRNQYGESQVIATDKYSKNSPITEAGPFVQVDVTHKQQLYDVVKKHQADTIIHLAALLSATAEERPLLAWKINMEGLIHTLEVARECDCQVFLPSSIGAFGPSTPKANTPQDTIQRPTTMYGINKLAGELLCDYYYLRYGVDTRGLRFPGLISYVTPPGGGTTDYAIDIFYQAVKKECYTCYLSADTYMDMMYMPDAIQAIITLMEADPSCLQHRNAYNISAMSLSPQSIANEIRKYKPQFEIEYEIDPERQRIADSWPDQLDTSAAREQWGFHPSYDLAAMTSDMLFHVEKSIFPSIP